MSHYYLSPYVGTGKEEDVFRPKGVDGLRRWTAIDLRADCTKVAGFALLEVDDPDSSIGPYLGDDPDAERPGLRGVFNGALKVTPEATRLRDIVAELLIVHAKDDGTRWKPVRPSKDGQFTIWLGGQRWGSFRPIKGGSTIVESFNKADSDTLGPDLSWTEFIGDMDVVSTQARVGTAGTSAVARANSDLATDDHYTESVTPILTLGTSSQVISGVFCRKDSTAADTFYLYHAAITSAPANRHQLLKRVAATQTQLGSDDATDYVTNEIMSIEADGSAITGKLNGVVSVGPITDTAITGNLRCGLRGNLQTGTGVVAIKPFRAGDLADIRCLHWASAKTTDGAHSSPIVVTIPATIAGNTLVVIANNGDDPTSPPAVSTVEATGASFSLVPGAVASITSGTKSARTEMWVARDIPAGITSVTVTWAALTLGVVEVVEYTNVRALGGVATATGTSADPSVSLATQNNNNMVVGGFCAEFTGGLRFAAWTDGIMRREELGTGDGSPDLNGCVVDNPTPIPATVVCSTTRSNVDGMVWAAVAIELRSNTGSVGVERLPLRGQERGILR